MRIYLYFLSYRGLSFILYYKRSPTRTQQYQMYICKHIFLMTFLNEPEFFFSPFFFFFFFALTAN